MNHKIEREYIENIRIEEYNKMRSEKFRMTMNLWRMRENSLLRRYGLFFTNDELWRKIGKEEDKGRTKLRMYKNL